MTLLPSLLRTLVPLVAGWIVVTVTGLGLDVDSHKVESAVTLAVAGAYYLLFRVVERVTEKTDGPDWLKAAAGLFLGYAKPPRYKPTDDVAELLKQSKP